MKRIFLTIIMSFLMITPPCIALANGPPSGCNDEVKTCIIPGGTKYIEGVPVYQSCWKYQVSYTCPNWSQYKNSCQNDINCSPEGSPIIVSPWEKHLTMQCTTSKVSYVCKKFKLSKNCQKKFTYDNGYSHFTTSPTKSFSKAMGEMGVLAGMAKRISVNPLSIFKGNSRICAQPLNLGPFTTNCCNENLSTHGGRLSFNKCSLNEIQLATGRRALRTHYIGTWCSHHLPWPLNSICIEHKQGYCEFGSMLGRVFQEQGRQQIDNIAINGGSHTITQNFQWPFSADGSMWNKSVVNGVAVAAYTWQGLSANLIPVNIATNTPLDVQNNASATANGVSVSMKCLNGICSGQMQQKQAPIIKYSMNPTCSNSPYSWEVGTAGIQQGVCLKPGQSPIDWPHISWTGNTPSLWQFMVLNAYQNTITNGSLETALPNGDGVSAAGSCTGNNCTFKVKVTSNNKTQSGDLNFPLNCKNSNHYTLSILGVSIAPQCAVSKEIFAVCSNGNACGPLPSNPLQYIGHSEHNWNIYEIGTSQPSFKFLSQSIAVKGSCQNNLCDWTLASIGPNGYKTVLNSNLSWNLFSAPMVKDKIQPGYPKNGMLTPVNILFKPYMYAPDSDISKGFKIQYKLPTEKNWVIYPGLMPLNVSQENPITLSQNPFVQMFGHCDAITGNCEFNLSAQVKVTAMPWGSPQNPQCEGFTPADMMLINPDKMNLSAWTKHITGSFGPNQQNQLSKFAKNSIKNFYNAMNGNGAVNSPTPNRSGYQVMKVVPAEGQGPFTATLYATAFWSKYIPYGQCGFPKIGHQNSQVQSINVNWGDGSSQTFEASSVVNVSDTGNNYNDSATCTYSVPLYKVTHQFSEPPGHNIIEHVKVTFNTKEGSHTATFRVDNFWNTPGIASSGGGIASPNNNPVSPNQLPGSGQFNPKNIPGNPNSSQQ